MHNSSIIQRKQTYIPALIMFIISHETVYIIAKMKYRQQDLSFDEELTPQPATSLQRSTQPYASVLINISAHYHPRAGHEFLKEKGAIQPCTQPRDQISKTTQLGLTGLQQIDQASTFQGGNHCIPAAKQEVHSSVMKEKTTRDNPKQNMSTAPVHKTTRSCSWP